jgi:hypothetical protein
MDGMDGMDGMVSGVKAAQSDALGWYGAFLQNAEVGRLGTQSVALVSGVPLGHGVERIGGGGRREVIEPGRLVVCWWAVGFGAANGRDGREWFLG